MKRFLLPLLFLLCATPAWSAPITKLKDLTKRAVVNKEPLRVLYGIDPSDPTKVIQILIDETGAIVTTAGGGSSTVKQGDQADDATTPWFFTMTRRSDGAEYGLSGSPFGVTLFNAAGNAIGTTADPIVTQPKVSTTSTPPGTIACTGTETSLGVVNLNRLELILENISDETISVGATGITHGSGFILAPGDVALDGLGEMIFIATTEEMFCISDGSTENLTVSELNK